MVLIFSLFMFRAIRGREFPLSNHARETHAHDIGDKCSKKNANIQKNTTETCIFCKNPAFFCFYPSSFGQKIPISLMLR